MLDFFQGGRGTSEYSKDRVTKDFNRANTNIFDRADENNIN